MTRLCRHPSETASLYTSPSLKQTVPAGQLSTTHSSFLYWDHKRTNKSLRQGNMSGASSRQIEPAVKYMLCHAVSTRCLSWLLTMGSGLVTSSHAGSYVRRQSVCDSHTQNTCSLASLNIAANVSSTLFYAQEPLAFFTLNTKEPWQNQQVHKVCSTSMDIN